MIKNRILSAAVFLLLIFLLFVSCNEIVEETLVVKTEITKRSGDKFGVDFLAWHDGVDAMLKPTADSPLPNVLIHVGRMVNTPLGICKGGMILINPENKEIPDFFGFVAEDEEIGKYYGPKIFKGTPFENAPVYKAEFTFNIDFPNKVATKVEVDGHTIELELTEFDNAIYYDRPGGMPFHQNVIEAKAHKAVFKFDGKVIEGELPPEGLAGGLPACYAPTGLYYIESK